MIENYPLLLAAFFSSIISGVIGMGGGIILLSIMALYFPLTVLVPLHATVQLASNITRTAIHSKHVELSLFKKYAFGAFLGAFIATITFFEIPEHIYKISLSLLILILTFAKGIFPTTIPGKWFGVGTFASFLSLYMGATGPILAPFFLQEKFAKEKIVATKAACQASTHILKLFSFIYLGFSFFDHTNILLGMILAVIIGTNIGKKILPHVSEKLFFRLFKGIILFLCLKMLYDGFSLQMIQ